MTNVMHQSCGKGYVLLVRCFTASIADDFHQSTCRVEDTDAMRKSRVSCTRVDQFRKTKLPNTAQTLERSRLDDVP